MSGWFWFWVVVCIVIALVIAGFAVAAFADFWGDSPVMAVLAGLLMLAVAVVVALLPWRIAADARWRQACADAGGIVVATDTWYMTQIVNGTPIITEHHNYACVRGLEVVDV